MATVVPREEGTAPAFVLMAAFPLGTQPPDPSGAPRRSFATRRNFGTVVGACLILTAAVTYASAEIAYTILANATPYDSYGWIYAAYGAAFFLFGLGSYFALRGLGRGWPHIGGIVVLFGSVLIAAGYIGWAAIRTRAGFEEAVWTNQVDALGFLFLLIGFALAFLGMGMLFPEGVTDEAGLPRRP